MQLSKRRCGCVPDPKIGAPVTARPPTVRFPLRGHITEIDGYTIAITLANGCLVAVDIEDCDYHPHNLHQCDNSIAEPPTSPTSIPPTSLQPLVRRG